MKDVSYTTISNINRGKRYKNDKYTYPLRKSKAKSKNSLSDEQLALIVEKIKTTSLSFKEIASQVNCSYDSVKRINDGKTHRIESETYPLRKN